MLLYGRFLRCIQNVCMIILMLSAYYDNGCAVVRHIKRCREIRRIVIGKTAFFEGHERIFLFLFSPKVKILAGVAVAALFNAGISFLSQLYPEALTSYASFSAGGFSGVTREDLPVPCGMIAAGVLLAWLLSSRLNLLCLGDELAQSLGVRVRLVRFTALVLSSVLCAAVVSFAGLLGFAGLIVPHIARRILGQDIRPPVPFCALAGGILVILSDLAARTLFSPAELPAGILMAALGAPFFLYLLIRKRRDGV